MLIFTATPRKIYDFPNIVFSHHDKKYDQENNSFWSGAPPQKLHCAGAAGSPPKPALLPLPVCSVSFFLESGVSWPASFVFLRSGGTPDKASRNNSGESGGAVGPRPAAATSCVRVDFLSLTPISPKQEIQQTPADSLGTLRPSEVTAVPKCRRPTLLLVKDGVSFPFQQWASVLALGQE